MGIVRRAQEVFVFHYWTLGGTFGTGSSVVIITGHFVVPLGQAVLWLSSLDTWWYLEDRQFCGYHHWTLGGTSRTGSSVVIIIGHLVVP